ncbi:hypothetical protein F4X73_13300 [Candidatus Poribacteria bacterium]|nr:hypothetical protein [Candidatus Poribacteria bacterium]
MKRFLSIITALSLFMSFGIYDAHSASNQAIYDNYYFDSQGNFVNHVKTVQGAKDDEATTKTSYILYHITDSNGDTWTMTVGVVYEKWGVAITINEDGTVDVEWKWKVFYVWWADSQSIVNFFNLHTSNPWW